MLFSSSTCSVFVCFACDITSTFLPSFNQNPLAPHVHFVLSPVLHSSPIYDISGTNDVSKLSQVHCSPILPPLDSCSLRFWFRPYGHVLELRPFSASELGRGPCRPPAYLVKLSSVDEARAARSALDGKPVMKGSPLVVRYWHG